MAWYEIERIIMNRHNHKQKLKDIGRYSLNNKTAIGKSEVCGCYYCCRTFMPLEIIEWIDSNNTALCPRCGIDSVLPSYITGIDTITDSEFLNDMHEYWFV